VKQLQIKFERPEPVRSTHYLDLNINEKINVNANSCGFQIVWLYHSLPWNRKHLGKVNFKDRPEQLTDRWFLHHKLNKNRVQPPKTTLF